MFKSPGLSVKRTKKKPESWSHARFEGGKSGKSGKEIREMLVQVYGDSAVKKTAVYSG